MLSQSNLAIWAQINFACKIGLHIVISMPFRQSLFDDRSRPAIHNILNRPTPPLSGSSLKNGDEEAVGAVAAWCKQERVGSPIR